jgi:ribonuclease R
LPSPAWRYGKSSAGNPPVPDHNRLLSLGEHCSDREQRAAQAERELTKLKLLHYLSERLGKEMVAIITGVEEIGLFVQGVELPAEGLVHVSSLADDYYRFDRTTHTLTGHRSNNRYRLGDTVLVVVAHVDIDRRELDFRLLERLPGPPKKKPSRSAPRKHRPTRTKAKAKPRAKAKTKAKGRARAKEKTGSKTKRGRGKR